MKTNEQWLRDLGANGTEQEDTLKDPRERLLHGMHAYLAEDRGYRSVPGSEEASQIIEDCVQEALLV